MSDIGALARKHGAILHMDGSWRFSPEQLSALVADGNLSAAAPAARAGWKFAPVEATEEMEHAAEKAELRHLIEDRRRGGGNDPQLGFHALYNAMIAVAPDAPAAQSIFEATFQQRVQPWMMKCFGPAISADVTERNHRFLEESVELVQSTGCTQSEAHQLVDYVYGRPVGDTPQEVGGVMITLAALCLAKGLDMHAAGETELARIWTKVSQIRAKQAAKPKHSPLPEAARGSEARDPAFPTTTTPQPSEPPLSGRWHHGSGTLVSGTIRIASWDCDTNPPVEFRGQMLDWMCVTLNAAVKAHERNTPDEFAAPQLGSTHNLDADLTALLLSAEDSVMRAEHVMRINGWALPDVDGKKEDAYSAISRLQRQIATWKART